MPDLHLNAVEAELRGWTKNKRACLLGEGGGSPQKCAEGKVGPFNCHERRYGHVLPDCGMQGGSLCFTNMQRDT